MSGIKNLCVKFWKEGRYTLYTMASVTTQTGSSKKFSCKEFEEIIGFSFEYYKQHEEELKDMRYDDVQEYLKNNTIE